MARELAAVGVGGGSTGGGPVGGELVGGGSVRGGFVGGGLVGGGLIGDAFIGGGFTEEKESIAEGNEDVVGGLSPVGGAMEQGLGWSVSQDVLALK